MKITHFFLMGIIFITINTQAMDKEQVINEAFLNRLKKEQAAWVERESRKKVLTREHNEAIVALQKSSKKKSSTKSPSLLQNPAIVKMQQQTLQELEEKNPRAFTLIVKNENKQDN